VSTLKSLSTMEAYLPNLLPSLLSDQTTSIVG
jgi:hypothetical protein